LIEYSQLRSIWAPFLFLGGLIIIVEFEMTFT